MSLHPRLFQATSRIQTTSRGRQPVALAMALAAILTLGACASTPPAPNRSLLAAEQAISTAEQARVADHASVELSMAREKLAAAKVAITREEMVLAERLADEALVDAQLATAKASEIKAKKVNEEMIKSTQTLKQEMERSRRTQQ